MKKSDIYQNLKKRLRQNSLDDNVFLNSILQQSEIKIDLANVITALRDNYKNIQNLDLCSELLIKFANKALQILGNTQQWLSQIEILLKQYHIIDKNPPSTLYLIKLKCLNCILFYVPEAELYINQAISLEKDKSKQIDLKLELAIYYENVSQYDKMKKILDQSFILCKKKF
jgi:hypothetical protein